MEQKNIEGRILEAIAKTEKLVSDYKEKTRPVAPDNAIGRVSRMDAIVNKSVMEVSLNKAEDKLNKLKHVLSKIGTSDFGICIRCGQTIPVARILAIPESPYCVNCAR